MNEVAITGYGITNFNSEIVPIHEKLFEATKKLFDNTKNITNKEIDAVLISSNDNAKYLAAIISELMGIKPKIAHSVESLCSSGTNAIITGIAYIISGIANNVLIIGGDLHNSPGKVLDWDKSRGKFKHPIFWASIFSKFYKRKFNVKDEDLAMISVKNHRFALDNPFAYSKKSYSVYEVLNSKKITDDIRLLECSKPCTGAAAILLTNRSISKKFCENPIKVKGFGQKTTSASFTKNFETGILQSVIESAQIAYNNAKITSKEIDVCEIHDAFTVCEALILEALHIAEKGKGAKFAKNLFNSEERKVNPRGGLIGAGHALGATGIAQTIEITQQLQKIAGKRQLENANIGLIQNMSAAATSSSVLILEN